MYIAGSPAPNHMPSDGQIMALTQVRAGELLQEGALPVDHTFSVASAGQADLIYQDRRLLVTPHDANYERYAAVMDELNVPHIAADPLLSTEHVVVGEIPRDARIITQIMRSHQSERGMQSTDVLYRTGVLLGSLAATAEVLPEPDDLSLQRVMILRNQGAVMLVPPVRLAQLTPVSVVETLDRIQSQLLPRYARFGGAALVRSFEEGFIDGRI